MSLEFRLHDMVTKKYIKHLRRQKNELTSLLATKSTEAYISGELSATRKVIPLSVVTTSAV